MPNLNKKNKLKCDVFSGYGWEEVWGSLSLKVVFVGLGLSAESRVPNLRFTVALNEIW